MHLPKAPTRIAQRVVDQLTETLDAKDLLAGGFQRRREQILASLPETLHSVLRDAPLSFLEACIEPKPAPAVYLLAPQIALWWPSFDEDHNQDDEDGWSMVDYGFRLETGYADGAVRVLPLFLVQTVTRPSGLEMETTHIYSPELHRSLCQTFSHAAWLEATIRYAHWVGRYGKDPLHLYPRYTEDPEQEYWHVRLGRDAQGQVRLISAKRADKARIHRDVDQLPHNLKMHLVHNRLLADWTTLTQHPSIVDVDEQAGTAVLNVLLFGLDTGKGIRHHYRQVATADARKKARELPRAKAQPLYSQILPI